MFVRMFACAMFLIVIFYYPVYGQGLITFSDEKWIDLSLDMIRKGVQQEDTAKLFKTFASQITTADKTKATRAALSARAQAVFNQAATRHILISPPNFIGDNNPLKSSSFWDFDILNPSVTIRGDSAFVACELVLWGGTPNAGSQKAGCRSPEQFVFYSQPKVKTPPLSGEGGVFPDSSIHRNRSWQLVRFDNLIRFLESQITAKQIKK
jgi:hypothetical protein